MDSHTLNPKAILNPKRVAILGPHGTFTEEAFLTQADLAAAEVLLCPSISDVLESVRDTTADLGFAAMENSIEGGINITLDSLAFESDSRPNLLIQREVIVGVNLMLWGLAGTELGKIRQVFSFPQAIAQCQGWLDKNLPGAETHAADSTASAIRMVAEGGDVGTVAIGTKRAGNLHKLDLLADNIADHPENKTRFVAIGVGSIPPPTGQDKTSVVIFQRANRPGGLLTILQEFAARFIDIVRLESRPTKKALGDYCFIVDFKGHIADELVADCLMNIRLKHADVKFLGSYPVTGEVAVGMRQEHSKDWQENKDWLAELRNQIR